MNSLASICFLFLMKSTSHCELIFLTYRFLIVLPQKSLIALLYVEDNSPNIQTVFYKSSQLVSPTFPVSFVIIELYQLYTLDHHKVFCKNKSKQNIFLNFMLVGWER